MGQISVKGKYNEAIIYTENVEEQAVAQIIELCNQEFVRDSEIRVMSDCHQGAGCTIGTTMTIKDKIVPNLVGVDIACGIECVQLKEKEIDLLKLDKIIHKHIPAGFNIRKEYHSYVNKIDLDKLKCIKNINKERALLSIGTLGSGNHFQELNKDDEGNLYLVVHSGSRNLGKQVAEYYQKLAYENLVDHGKLTQELTKKLRIEGREKEIQNEIAKIKKFPKISKELAYLEGEFFNNYLHDMRIVQLYAELNRKAMINEIVSLMSLNIVEQFTTVHNYIDLDFMILRKGAISAQLGEKVLIPMNMRDGSLICVGKGNLDWNYSAPHGAGRLMSRSKAKENIALSDFVFEMRNVFSTTVNKSTLDEAPMAYKPMQEIMENIKDTVEVIKVIKPIYNFKSSE